jgi:hypothetical protein
MKKYMLITLMILAVASFAAAQIQIPTSDVLGAHLNYGRGCAACHAPHSGAYGNGAAKHADPNAGSDILWGQDVASLYGQTINFGQTLGHKGLSSYSETLPSSLTATTPDVTGLLVCLSCHDGNWAQGAMMKNKVYETLPPTYGTWNNVPTLLGDGNGTPGVTNYLADHPVGLNAVVACGAPWDWDCTITNGTINMTGPQSKAFVQDYGFFVSPAVYSNNPVVMCTTCHNQHLMNVVNISSSTQSGLPVGEYATMFFLVGPYNPASTTSGSNQTAQFCRQCHGANANEFYNANLPTIF